MTPDILRQGLRSLFGDEFGIGVTDPKSADHPLWTEEEEAVAQAVPKRQKEFAAGRAAARQALAEIGQDPAAIPTNKDRSPIWPYGIAGSISHSDQFCVAVTLPDALSLGVDIEPTAPLEPGLWDIVLTPEEQQALSALPDSAKGHRAKQIFCAKEAAYKAQYPLSKTIFDFQTLEIRFFANGFTAEFLKPVPPFVEAGKIRGCIFEESDHIIAGALIRT